MVGRLLEIKFPTTRKIIKKGDLDGEEKYLSTQLLYSSSDAIFVTGLDECDFLQCKIEEYNSWEDFVRDSRSNNHWFSIKTNLEKGCLIQLLPKKLIGGNDPKYVCTMRNIFIRHIAYV